MTNAETAGNILCFAVTAVLFYVLFYYLWQEYVIEYTRQKLFGLRARLFDKATEGVIERDGEPYRMLWELLNATIRYMHEFSIWHLMRAAIEYERDEDSIRKEAQAIKDLFRTLPEGEARKVAWEIYEEMHDALIGHMVKRSLFVILILLPIGAGAAAFSLLSSTVRRYLRAKWARFLKNVARLVDATLYAAT